MLPAGGIELLMQSGDGQERRSNFGWLNGSIRTVAIPRATGSLALLFLVFGTADGCFRRDYSVLYETDVPRPAQLPRNGGPKLRNPSADRFVWNIYTALQKHLFHLAKAEIEPAIQPDCVSDDFRWKTVTFVAEV